MEDIQNAINSLEISLIRNEDEIITDCFSRKTLKTAIKALEKQAFFENQISNISDWFIDNKEVMLDSAIDIANKRFTMNHNLGLIDKIDLDFIIEDVVDEIQKGILNVLDTFKDS